MGLVEQLAQVAAVQADESARMRCQVDGMVPAVVALPASEGEVAACLRTAARCGAGVVPRGGGSRMGLGGSPTRCDVVLSLERLSGVVEYVPEDLTVTVQAGMPLHTLQELVGRRNQEVPLDPTGGVNSTVGGVLAAGAVGPRRMLYGGPRDVLLGARVALADGRVIQSGGRVVKNVAGYDLNKLWVGSLGTLGVLTEVTLKLRPRAKCCRTLCFSFSDVGGAAAAADAVLNSELLPAAVTILSPGAAGRLGLPASAVLAVELAESEANVAYEVVRLHQMMEGLAGGAEAEPSGRFWQDVRDYHRIGRACWRLRVSAVPGDLGALMAAALAGTGVEVIAHAGAGTLLVYGQEPAPALISALQQRAAALGGAAVLEEAPPDLKRQVAVWGPPRPEWRLMRQIKETLDPGGVLNPGRFVGGI